MLHHVTDLQNNQIAFVFHTVDGVFDLQIHTWLH